MPRQLQFTLDNIDLVGSLKKFSRETVYGKKTELRRDLEGIPLQSIYLSPDGLYLIQKTVAQYMSMEGKYVPKENIKEIDLEGEPLRIYPTMFKQGISLNDLIPLNDMFLIDVELSYVFFSEGTEYETFYGKIQQQFQNGYIYHFLYSYYATSHPKHGVLIPKNGKIVALVGKMTQPELLGQDRLELLDEIDIEEETEFEVW
ncbi:MAG: hypothetical protein ACTSRK_01275 [Promethearchaeota archaeon]